MSDDATSYHNLAARGSIEGLKIIAINSDEETKEDIENFMIEKIKRTEESRLRRSAVSSLGYVGRYKENKERIVQELKALLSDESFYVRNTACVALANILENTGDSDAIKELKHIAEQDQSSGVRATANVCIDIIKGESKKGRKRKIKFTRSRDKA